MRSNVFDRIKDLIRRRSDMSAALLDALTEQQTQAERLKEAVRAQEAREREYLSQRRKSGR